MRQLLCIAIIIFAVAFAGQTNAEDSPQSEPASTSDSEVSRDRDATWISLGVLMTILLLGGIIKVRIDRSARKALEDNGEDQS